MPGDEKRKNRRKKTAESVLCAWSLKRRRTYSTSGKSVELLDVAFSLIERSARARLSVFKTAL